MAGREALPEGGGDGLVDDGPRPVHQRLHHGVDDRAADGRDDQEDGEAAPATPPEKAAGSPQQRNAPAPATTQASNSGRPIQLTACSPRTRFGDPCTDAFSRLASRPSSLVKAPLSSTSNTSVLNGTATRITATAPSESRNPYRVSGSSRFRMNVYSPAGIGSG